MISHNPLVTVGIPTYNRPEGLRKTLECVIKQTYLNLEVIVSDNCSTDAGTEAVLSEFSADSRVKIYRQSENRGAVFNINFVLEKANGDYFMRIADDDWLDTNYIECCMKALLESSSLVASYGYAKICDTNGNFMRNDPEVSFQSSTATTRIIKYLTHIECNGTFYSLFRREMFPYIFEERQLGDDWLVLCRVLFSGEVKMVENTNCYISQGGISQTLESITQNLNLHPVTKYFPYLSIAVNLAVDIVFKSKAYKKLSIYQRCILAAKSGYRICRRFYVKTEIKKGLRKLLVTRKINRIKLKAA
jgi:glycosyltransferase involved in cell wall biosynthesis